jgi:hypothetical protein
MDNTRVYRMSFASVYPHYIRKAERKGRTKAELDEIIFWLTGYDQQMLQQLIDNKTDFETFSPRHHKLTRMFPRSQGLSVAIVWKKSKTN